MRLVQRWAILFIASTWVGAVAVIATGGNAAPSWVRTTSAGGVLALGGFGAVLVACVFLRLRTIKRRLGRAVTARREAPIAAPSDVIERAFAPLVESRAVRDLSVAVILPRRHIIWFPSGDEKVRETRLYEIGSLTKPMTAELLATMIADGTAAMATRVGDVLTESSLPDSIAAITLEELVTHQSGLPRLPRSLTLRCAAALSGDPYRWLSGPALLRSLARARRAAPRGTYSNFGFAVLGRALGERHSSDYARAFDARLLRPLGLANTYVDPEGEIASRLMRGHDAIGIRTPRWHFGAVAGAGGVCMTIADGATWLAAHIEPPSEFREIVRMVTQPRAPLGGGRIGMGWCIHEVKGTAIVWHNGGTGGFSSFAAFDPAHEVGVIAFAASAHDAALDRAGFEVVSECATRWGRS